MLGFTGCNTDTEEKCPGDTTSVAILLTVPPGVAGAVLLSGPNGYSMELNASDTLTGLSSGEYRVSTKRVKLAGSIVGKAYYGQISEPAFTLTACTPNSVTVAYVQEPGSEKLWVASNSRLHAFAAANLAATGAPAPDISLKTPAAPRSIAFDTRGNLWFANAEGVFMYAMEDLGTAAAVYRVKLTGPGVTGVGTPGAGSLAFDDEGSLWIAQIADRKIVKLTAAQIAATGQPTPTVTISSPDLDGTESLAFDAAGNLFAASGDVLRFSRASLTTSYSGAADAKIVHRTGPPVIGIITLPNNLAFNKDGTLWITYFNSGSLIPLLADKQAVSDTLIPVINIEASVLALVEGLTIDEAGSLWIPGKAGKILSVASGSLGVSGNLAAAVTLSSPAVDYAGAMAFNPAAEALPLRD